MNLLDPGGSLPRLTFPSFSAPTGAFGAGVSAASAPVSTVSPWAPPSWPTVNTSVFGRRLPSIGASYPGAAGFGSAAFASWPTYHPSASPGVGGSSSTTVGAPPKPPPRPNYNINTDPYVLAARAANQRRRQMFTGMSNRQRREAIIKSGDVNLAKAQGMSAADIAATAANYSAGNADLARVDEQNKLAHQAIINQLAGRGILFSGETGYQEAQQGRAYGQQTYDLRTNVLDYLQQLSDALQQEYEQERETEEQALAQATANQIAQASAWDQMFGQSILGGG